MAASASLIEQEIRTVITAGEAGTSYKISLSILANNQWINPLRLDLWSLERDYVGSYGDVLVVQFIMPYGDYTYDLLPYRANLKVDVTYQPLKTATKELRTDTQTTVTRYVGILVDQNDHVLTGGNSQTTTKDALNRLAPKTVVIQLMEESLYLTRLRTVGRNFRQCTPMDALLTVLTETINLQKGSNYKRMLGIHVADGYNTEKRNVIPIPDGTPVMSVANMLQQKEGGVYPAGLGCYLQDQYWWVFPLYDTKRINKKLKTLTIYNVPPDKYDGGERTYRITANRVIVLAAGDATSFNPSGFNQLNGGNGIRFADARKLLGDFAITKDNRMLIDRATNLFEFVSSPMDGTYNNVQFSDTPVSANPFRHYTAMALSDGQFVAVEWKHGESDLLLPGMPVEYWTLKDNQAVSYQGILLGLHEERAPSEPGAVASSYPGVVRLKVFINTTDKS